LEREQRQKPVGEDHIKKPQIYLHRAYRKVVGNKWHWFLYVLIGLIIPDILLYIYFPKITALLSGFSAEILAESISSEFIEIVRKSFIYRDVSYLAIPGRFPTFNMSLITIIVSAVLGILILWNKNKVKPPAIWLTLVLFTHLISGLYFILWPDFFPYSSDIFSELYIKTEVAMWFVIPVVLTFALIYLPTNLIGKTAFIFFVLIYDVIFACFRYIVFLYLLNKMSFLFMAGMYFLFGPLIDFFCIVGFYSLYINWISKSSDRDIRKWNWLY